MANSIARGLRKRMTGHEVMLWSQLRLLKRDGYHFRRQAPLLDYIVDFACLRHRLVVELDGSQHGHHSHAASDAQRDATLTAAGYRVLRFWNSDLDRDLVAVLDTIIGALAESTPPTGLRPVPPPRSGEG